MSLADRVRADTPGTISAGWRAGAGAAGTGLALVAAASDDDRLRGAVLATMLLLVAGWLIAEGWARRQGRASGTLLLGVAVLALFAVPAAIVQLDRGLLVERSSATAGMALLAVGAVAVVAGVSLVRPGRRMPVHAGHPGPAGLGPFRRAVVVVLPLLAFAVFIAAAGGPRDYFANLDDTAARTAGLTYLIWGVLFAKFFAVVRAAQRWRAGARLERAEVAALIGALLLVGAIGARLLVIVFVIQTAFVYALTRGRPARLALLAAVLVLLAGVFVGLGELRRYQSLPAPGHGFPAFLVETGLPHLPATYVNQYADAVPLAARARALVPAQAPFEHGREIMRIALQPIPGPIRPSVARDPALEAAFTSGEGNGNALPLPVVGYLQFGVAGTVIFCGLLGLAAGAVDRRLRRPQALSALLAGVGLATGLLMILRGTLTNAVAFAGIDVLGFWVAAWFMRADCTR